MKTLLLCSYVVTKKVNKGLMRKDPERGCELYDSGRMEGIMSYSRSRRLTPSFVLSATVGDNEHFDRYAYRYLWRTRSLQLASKSLFDLNDLPSIETVEFDVTTGVIAYSSTVSYASGDNLIHFIKSARIVLHEITSSANSIGIPKTYRPDYSSISDPVNLGFPDSNIKYPPHGLVSMGVVGKRPKIVFRAIVKSKQSRFGLYSVEIKHKLSGEIDSGKVIVCPAAKRSINKVIRFWQRNGSIILSYAR